MRGISKRPYLLDFVQYLFTDFMELHGDRAFGDDKAIIAGLAKYHGAPGSGDWPPKGPRHETVG